MVQARSEADLALLRHAIEQVIPAETRDFFLVAFAAKVREISNTRLDEYKLYRIPESKLHAHTPRVFDIFWERVRRNLRGLEEFFQTRVPSTSVQVYERDLRQEIPIETATVDIIVTSPPYGDSQTTVAYGQFSRLVLQWLGYDDTAKSIDRRAGWEDCTCSGELRVAKPGSHLGHHRSSMPQTRQAGQAVLRRLRPVLPRNHPRG